MNDEKKLIEKIWNIFSETYNNAFNFDEDESKLVERVMIDVQNAIEEQPKIGGWIPCSERLPDKGVMNPITNDYAEYLCTVCVDGFRTVRPIKFDKDGCWVNHGMNFDKYVTAWQPLPEAYHG